MTKKFYDIFRAARFITLINKMDEQTEIILPGCNVTCPGCQNKMTLYHRQWAAIVCTQCKAELYVEPKTTAHKQPTTNQGK